MQIRPHEQRALDKLTNEYKSALTIKASETGLIRLAKHGHVDMRVTKQGSASIREFKVIGHQNG
jgi:hypothetical protein